MLWDREIVMKKLDISSNQNIFRGVLLTWKWTFCIVGWFFVYCIYHSLVPRPRPLRGKGSGDY